MAMSCIQLHSINKIMKNSRMKWTNVKPSQVVQYKHPHCISYCLFWVIYYIEIQIFGHSVGENSNIRKNIRNDTCSKTGLKTHHHLRCILKSLQA